MLNLFNQAQCTMRINCINDVNYMIAIGVSYILLDGQLVLSYVYISNPVKLIKVKCQGQLY